MSVGAAVRRVRAYGGQFLLLAVLTLVVTLLISGVPRLVNRLAEQGLRAQLNSEPAARRDISYTSGVVSALATQSATNNARQRFDALAAGMPPQVRLAVNERWYNVDAEAARVVGPDLAARNLLVDLGLRAVPDIKEAATLVEGAWPSETYVPDRPIEVVLDVDVAGKLNLRTGSQLRIGRAEGKNSLVDDSPLTVVGLFRPVDRTGGSWDGLPSMLRITDPIGDGEPFIVTGAVAPSTLDKRAAAGWSIRYNWRYRLGVDSIDARKLDQLIDGLQESQRSKPADLSLAQGIDIPLRAFAAQVNAARTLLAVIAAGVLATLAGLILLAATLATRRRRSEFVLIRARGGGATAGARRSLAESLLVVPVAAVLGWWLGTLLPGAPDPITPYAIGATVLVTLALPLATLAVPTGGASRRDLVRMRPSTRRLTGELFVLGLAVLAAVLLRRRGLTLGEVDPLLVSVPVLLAIAAAVLALRAYPWPLLLVSRLAARTRGSVTFLGTARAGRSAVAAPLVVVVLAIGTAAFCAVVAAGVDASRDRAAEQIVPADAVIRGERFAPDTVDELGRLPGIRAVTRLLYASDEQLASDELGTSPRLGGTAVLLVDGSGLATVARESEVDLALPEPLRTARPEPGPLPAIVSPAVAADLTKAGLDRSAFISVQGQRYEFRVAGSEESFPLLSANTSRFVILPWQALPARNTTPVATSLLVAGDRLDAEALRRAGDQGQLRYQQEGAVTGRERPIGVVVDTRADVRRDLGNGGANGVLAFGFVAGAAGGSVLGLLAIAFTVLAGARARGQVLSRLRTLGLSRRQWRGLLLVELAPLVGVSVLTGALVGAVLPLLLNPVLGLSAFTSGMPVRVAFEPGLVAAVLALGVVALGFAVAVEALNNRRLRLGEVLRLGEES
ncbi:putative ABC transport system permease protein [Micromonospora luteifusca]|uniref:ABC transport system permease protein n=1 Tax=Micromonospora luteifusca TaxID=709860 RepID=A0ABS2LZE2_9ACTN|nr:FtsX-like permease family protein [Micromonospora luteifusca]MBM7493239.1 putative ABC transport system permease protein [Micromonospora luteifusca]